MYTQALKEEIAKRIGLDLQNKVAATVLDVVLSYNTEVRKTGRVDRTYYEAHSRIKQLGLYLVKTVERIEKEV